MGKGRFYASPEVTNPFGSQIFSYKWVDKWVKGVHKSRFTCADPKARYNAGKEEGLDVLVTCPLARYLFGVSGVVPNTQSSGASLVQRALQGDGKPLWKKDRGIGVPQRV